MEKLLFSSARRPEKVWLVRRTSRWTSFAMLSTVPGFDSPSALLRSWKDLYVSRKVSTMLLVRGGGRPVGKGAVSMGITGFSKGGAAMVSSYGVEWRSLEACGQSLQTQRCSRRNGEGGGDGRLDER